MSIIERRPVKASRSKLFDQVCTARYPLYHDNVWRLRSGAPACGVGLAVVRSPDPFFCKQRALLPFHSHRTIITVRCLASRFTKRFSKNRCLPFCMTKCKPAMACRALVNDDHAGASGMFFRTSCRSVSGACLPRSHSFKATSLTSLRGSHRTR